MIIVHVILVMDAPLHGPIRERYLSELSVCGLIHTMSL